MKKITFQVLLTCCAGILFSPFSLADAIGASIGLHGIAINYQKAFSNKLSSRLILSDMPLERDLKEEGIEYKVEYDRTNMGVLLDYHPFSGGFHISGGIYAGDHNWIMKAKAINQELELGDGTYTSKDVQLEAQVSFAKAAPYFGIGWGYAIQQKLGFSANLDIGALYIGQPSISYQAKGTVIDDNGNELNVATFADFQGNVELERAKLETKLEDYDLLPIIQFGLAITF